VTTRRLEPGPPRERSFWQLLPRRNFRYALFLVVVLLVVLILRRTGGLSFSKMFDSIAPPPRTPAPSPSTSPSGEFRHLEVHP
jgi:hypothetical protein